MSYTDNLIPVRKDNIVESGSTITGGDIRIVALEDSTITVTWVAGGALTRTLSASTGDIYFQGEFTSISIDTGKVVKV
jgi:hypothetical protein